MCAAEYCQGLTQCGFLLDWCRKSEDVTASRSKASACPDYAEQPGDLRSHRVEELGVDRRAGHRPVLGSPPMMSVTLDRQPGGHARHGVSCSSEFRCDRG